MTCQPRRRSIATALLALTATVCGGEPIRADGGRLVRVERINGWIVSVFVTPDPPRVGPIDVSVLVQAEASGSVIADADIAVTLTAAGDAEGVTTSAPSSRDQATNKLLQSALLNASSPGDWQGTIDCRVGNAKVEIPFPLQIVAAPPAWTKLALWILWPFAAAAIFVAHRMLGRKRA
ncbi:hypothetical protein [Lacipirellula limnantheis]|uniref:Uncharacterized protein n=1 Tax=Lacipirellula limnantheis TaxID=2528024 RepID=A0A517U4P2_9BACT|nr:hypothetical protein [Lacipirellula limnantheis]QDT75599.1 hypothetical protein I41_48110 [Lacipirellula limnantheis]